MGSQQVWRQPCDLRFGLKEKTLIKAQRILQLIERQGPLTAGKMGLSLVEAKAILQSVQAQMVRSQYQAHVNEQRMCGRCGQRRTLKDYHGACFKSLFGDVTLRVPRL